MQVLRAGDLGDLDREPLLGLDAGELCTTSNQTSGTFAGELRVGLVERRADVVGMMNQEARAEYRFKPNDKLPGVLDQVKLKTATLLQSPKKILISTRNKFYTFGIGICELVYLGYPGAGGEAYCLVLSHHRGAAPQFLKNFEIV